MGILKTNIILIVYNVQKIFFEVLLIKYVSWGSDYHGNSFDLLYKIIIHLGFFL